MPDVDDLFKLPPAEFTAARNALAAQLKKAGRNDEAADVKALPKPPVSAWAVNQLFWRHRKPFDQLLSAGERFRKAQASQLAGKASDLRAPLEERRGALAHLTRIAAKMLQESGHPATPDIMRRIGTTLEALATYGSHPDAPRAGRLTDDIDPPGFEALAALVPDSSTRARGETGPSRVIPFQPKKAEPRASRRKKDPKEEAREREEQLKAERAAAKTAVQDGERTLRDARKAAAQAEAALKKAAAQAKETERVKEDLEKRFEKATADADAARQHARRVASQAEEAAQAVDEAERALEKAKRELESLS